MDAAREETYAIPRSSSGVFESSEEGLMLNQPIGIGLQHVIGFGIPVRAVLGRFSGRERQRGQEGSR
jgi:hypothetical protein